MENENKEAEFKAMVNRLNGSGDYKILIDALEVFRDDCKYQRYSEEVYKSPEMLQHWNGSESAYDSIIELLKSSLEV